MAEKSPTGSAASMSKDGEKGDVAYDIHQMRSMSIGDVVEMVDTTHGQFHRSFTPHQVHVGIQPFRTRTAQSDLKASRSFHSVLTSALVCSSVPVLLWLLLALEIWSLRTFSSAHASGLSCRLSLK